MFRFRLLRTFLIASAAILSGCVTQAPKAPEKGVPFSLAEYRSSSISNVSYNITLTIPCEKDSAIRGNETVSFYSAKKGDVFLDFSPAEGEHIKLKAKKGMNEFNLDFVSDNRFLNRNDEYLYSLFVPAHARSVFPCFDQPDIKAKFTLTLNLPSGWTAVSNAPAKTSESVNGRETITFDRTEPISTYLFSFTAGIWDKVTTSVDGREITAYYREKDPVKVSQLPDIFNEVGQALAWMEEYTGIKMPFPKYDFVIVPNFQFGGMEHPGAILFNENTMFLGERPTPDERLRRIELITHETAHLWFGDLVTMRWFDEVWTKEVFANHLAAKMAEPMFPEINHDLSWLKGYLAPAMDEERTEGATAIRQELPNLADAGLIYNNMVYDKAPVMMRTLEESIGSEIFRAGLGEYLKRYSYKNTTWDDLVAILDSLSDKDVRGFSESWVNKRRGGDMPGLLRSFADGSREVNEETAREAEILLRKEEYLSSGISPREYLDILLEALNTETNPLIASTIVSSIGTPLLDIKEDVETYERRLLAMAESHPLESCQLQLKRTLASVGRSEETVKWIYEIWFKETDKALTVNDYMSFACQLAIRMPEKAGEIISKQRKRLDGSYSSRVFSQNRLEQFDFISGAASPKQASLDSVFTELLKPSGREIEPWAETALSYLNHFLRDSSSVKYIRPGLDVLLDVKEKGDIFFPGKWCKALLGGHTSDAALKELESFLNDNPDYPESLKNKILVAAYNLQRSN